MKKVVMAVALLAAAGGEARATYVSPQLGLSTTLSEVGNQSGYSSSATNPLGFHLSGSQGTPGLDPAGRPLTPNPSAYSDPTSSSVSGYDVMRSTSYTAVAAGSAAADLASGQMHLVGQTTRLGTAFNDSTGASIFAQTNLADVITITGPITGSVTVRISLVMDGSITGSSPGGGGAPTDLMNDNANFFLEAGSQYAELFLNNFEGSTIQEQDASSYGGKVITDAGLASALHFTLYDDVVVTDTTRTIPFLAGAGIGLVFPDSPGTITADFGNTARLEVALPDGLSFTSQSGVLLTQPQDNAGTTDVPEPASLLLLASGIAAAAVQRRRGGSAG